jgi:FAD/FMN-containing dehydrogenase
MGAGHALSPFLSSTTGIHISTAAFTSIKYNNATKRVTFGAGLNWVELYTALQPHGVGVPGARAPGVGVGGFVHHGIYDALIMLYHAWPSPSSATSASV